jgi:hypothetical protein
MPTRSSTWTKRSLVAQRGTRSRLVRPQAGVCLPSASALEGEPDSPDGWPHGAGACAGDSSRGTGGSILDGNVASVRRTRLAASVTTTCAVAAGVLACVVPSAGSAGSGDVAATDSYLTAVDAYEHAALANAPASAAAFEALAGSIGAECAGVLKGVPPEGSQGSSTSFARQIGEAKREDEQLAEVENELSGALAATFEQPDRQALLTFAAAVRPLRWSDPVLTQLVDAEASEVEERVAVAIPDVCADMKAWAASGYKTLSPATLALRAKNEEASRNARARPTQSLTGLMARYEGSAEKALIAEAKKLRQERRKALRGLQGASRQLNATLGAAQESEPTLSHPPAGAVVVGKGTTASGGRYEVLVEPAGPSAGRRQSECSPDHPLSVRILTNFGMGVSGCFSRSEVGSPPSVNCAEGLLRLEARTGAAVRSVSLRLSNGRRVVSRVAFVPARLGGPTGFYFQVVRGPSPIPVSLTEFDARGRPLRVFKLYRFVGCTKHLLKFLPGGIRTLVRDRIPRGPEFSIQGEAYRFLGRIHFALQVDVAGQGGGGRSPSGQKPNLFSWALYTGCRPHGYAITYGVLKAPRDTVLARTSGVLLALRRVAIPAHLHAGGVLVYTASSTVPSELIVRDPAGRTILTEKLGRLGAEAAERCEGESEGTAAGSR